MFNAQYNSLLQELAVAMAMPPLEPDDRGCCTIRFRKENVSIQFEPDPNGENILILSILGKLGPGKYREEVMKEALHNNAEPMPHYGNFAYNGVTDELCLWDTIPLKELRGVNLANYLSRMLEKAAQWKELIDHNELPRFSQQVRSNPSGLFGLR